MKEDRGGGGGGGIIGGGGGGGTAPWFMPNPMPGAIPCMFICGAIMPIIPIGGGAIIFEEKG